MIISGVYAGGARERARAQNDTMGIYRGEVIVQLYYRHVIVEH